MSDSSDKSVAILNNLEELSLSKEALESKSLEATVEKTSVEVFSSAAETPDEVASTGNPVVESKLIETLVDKMSAEITISSSGVETPDEAVTIGNLAEESTLLEAAVEKMSVDVSVSSSEVETPDEAASIGNLTGESKLEAAVEKMSAEITISSSAVETPDESVSIGNLAGESKLFEAAVEKMSAEISVSSSRVETPDEAVSIRNPVEESKLLESAVQKMSAEVTVFSSGVETPDETALIENLEEESKLEAAVEKMSAEITISSSAVETPDEAVSIGNLAGESKLLEAAVEKMSAEISVSSSGVETSDKAVSIGNPVEEPKLKTAIEKMSAEVSSSRIETPDEAVSAGSSGNECENDPLTAICLSTEFDSTKSECITKDGHKYKIDASSKGDIDSAIANIRKAMKENELLLEKSLKFSSNYLKNLPKSSQHSTISSMKRIRESSSSDTLSTTSEGESEMSFEVRKVLANQFSNSSGYFSPISSESVTPVSTSENSDFAERSLTSNSRKLSVRSDSLETLVTERYPSTIPWENINNSFCYSVITLSIRRHYNTLFDFAEFKNACSLSSNAYKKLLNIKYISIPLSRYLMEDLLDFVDFLNGTGLELREPESNLCPSNYEDRKLAFVRENFANGVQQHESITLCNLMEELYNYYQQSMAIKEPSNPSDKIASAQDLLDSSESQQGKLVSDLDVTPKQSSKSYHLVSLDRYRMLKLEPEIENLRDPFIGERLEISNYSIKRLMIRCISDTRMILDICIHTKYNVLSQRLIRYFPEIESLLHRLVLLREDSGKLLGNWNGQAENATTLHILRVKLQVASAFKKLLVKFSEINSEFLGN